MNESGMSREERRLQREREKHEAYEAKMRERARERAERAEARERGESYSGPDSRSAAERQRDKELIRDAAFDAKMRARAEERAAREVARETGQAFVKPTVDALPLGISDAARPFRESALHISVAAEKGPAVLIASAAGLELTRESLLLGTQVPWAQIESVDIQGPNSSERQVTVPRVLALGVLALAVPKDVTATYLVIQRDNGEPWLLVAKGASAPQVSAALAPYLTSWRAVRSSRALAASAPDTGVVDTLERLAALREAGHLSEAEFAAAKTRALGTS